MADPKLYKRDEVAKENNGETTLMIIHNSVYNVTAYLKEHPGGEEVLLEQGGKDATEAFEDVGHSLDARDLMDNYKVGELVPEDRLKKLSKKEFWHLDGCVLNQSYNCKAMATLATLILQPGRMECFLLLLATLATWLPSFMTSFHGTKA
uniref:Cytochrome b5 n=2 Tax=Timema TaxID=61471 RepID=A0A7R9JQ30_TIMGE|nr:unnamed protein product [Timema genevievae]